MPDPVSEETGPQPVGIVDKLARDDLERKKFLKIAGKSMGAAGAASALGIFIAACGSSSKTTSSATTAAAPATTGGTSAGLSSGDLAIANYALTLEYLETEFYAKVIASGLFSGKTLSTLKTFGAEEAQHVAALKTAVAKYGGTPAAKPKGKFPIKSATQVAKLAASVENLGAAAYLGQATNIESPVLLASALAIHTVEGRHAAVLQGLINASPTPDGAFAKPMTMAQVLAAVKPYIAA